MATEPKGILLRKRIALFTQNMPINLFYGWSISRLRRKEKLKIKLKLNKGKLDNKLEININIR